MLRRLADRLRRLQRPSSRHPTSPLWALVAFSFASRCSAPQAARALPAPLVALTCGGHAPVRITALLFRVLCGAASQLKLAGSYGQRYRVYVASAHEGARSWKVAVRYVVALAPWRGHLHKAAFCKVAHSRQQSWLCVHHRLRALSGLQNRPYAKYPPLGLARVSAAFFSVFVPQPYARHFGRALGPPRPVS